MTSYSSRHQMVLSLICLLDISLVFATPNASNCSEHKEVSRNDIGTDDSLFFNTSFSDNYNVICVKENVCVDRDCYTEQGKSDLICQRCPTIEVNYTEDGMYKITVQKRTPPGIYYFTTLENEGPCCLIRSLVIPDGPICSSQFVNDGHEVELTCAWRQHMDGDNEAEIKSVNDNGQTDVLSSYDVHSRLFTLTTTINVTDELHFVNYEFFCVVSSKDKTSNCSFNISFPGVGTKVTTRPPKHKTEDALRVNVSSDEAPLQGPKHCISNVTLRFENLITDSTDMLICDHEFDVNRFELSSSFNNAGDFNYVTTKWQDNGSFAGKECVLITFHISSLPQPSCSDTTTSMPITTDDLITKCEGCEMDTHTLCREPCAAIENCFTDVLDILKCILIFVISPLAFLLNAATFFIVCCRCFIGRDRRNKTRQTSQLRASRSRVSNTAVEMDMFPSATDRRSTLPSEERNAGRDACEGGRQGPRLPPRKERSSSSEQHQKDQREHSGGNFAPVPLRSASQSYPILNSAYLGACPSDSKTSMDAESVYCSVNSTDDKHRVVSEVFTDVDLANQKFLPAYRQHGHLSFPSEGRVHPCCHNDYRTPRIAENSLRPLDSTHFFHRSAEDILNFHPTNESKSSSDLYEEFKKTNARRLTARSLTSLSVGETNVLHTHVNEPCKEQSKRKHNINEECFSCNAVEFDNMQTNMDLGLTDKTKVTRLYRGARVPSRRVTTSDLHRRVRQEHSGGRSSSVSARSDCCNEACHKTPAQNCQKDFNIRVDAKQTHKGETCSSFKPDISSLHESNQNTDVYAIPWLLNPLSRDTTGEVKNISSTKQASTDSLSSDDYNSIGVPAASSISAETDADADASNYDVLKRPNIENHQVDEPSQLLNSDYQLLNFKK